VTRITFGSWLRQAIVLIVHAPLVWAGYTLFIGILFSVGRVSLALGVFLSVTCLFVGVGVAKYIDLKSVTKTSVSFNWAVRRSLPLAVLAASSIVFCWFVFRIVANIYSGEIYKISQFFFYWDIRSENLDDKSMRQIAAWIYSSSMATLLFVLLMLTSFANWFSYPLMLFKNYSWSQAKERGNKASTENHVAMYKLLAFVFAAVLIGAGVMPLLTPVLYMLVSTLMYVSYKAVFESTRS
jgi:hypothetical protein